jgi:hypothetical protein
MKNLMKQIVMALSLTLMVASLVALSPDQAQAKVKKQNGARAKVKSQSERLSIFAWHQTVVEGQLKSQSKRLSVRNGNVRASYDIRRPKP